MPELYPVPSYEEGKVFAQKRSADFDIREGEINEDELAPGEVSEQSLLELADFLQYEQGEFFQELKGNPNPDWQEISNSRMKRCAEILEEYEHPLEKALIRSFMLTLPMFDQTLTRRSYNERMAELSDMEEITESTEREKQQLYNLITEMNVFGATWQNEVSKMTLGLRNSKEGLEVLEQFWQSVGETATKFIPTEGQRESQILRKGVEGFLATRDIFEELGFETYFPYAKQDAVEKIDLWAKKDEKILALQIKAHQGDAFSVKVERVRTAYHGYADLPRIDRDHARQNNILLTASRKYSKLWSKEVVPLWVDLSSVRGMRFFQDDHGRLKLPTNLDRSQLAQEISQEIA